MTTLRVGADADAVASGRLRDVLGSLPLSLTARTSRQRADLVAVDGGPGWSQRLAGVGGSVRGILLVHPSSDPQAPSGLTTLVPVVVDYRFASNPALPLAAAAFDGWPSGSLIEVSATVASTEELDRLVLDQLATLRALRRMVARLRVLTWARTGYLLEAVVAGGSLALLRAEVTTALPPLLQVRGVSPTSIVEISLPDPATAQPGTVCRSTPAGTVTTPTPWETSHRAAWRRLHAAAGVSVEHGAPGPSDLAALGDDISLVARAIRIWSP